MTDEEFVVLLDTLNKDGVDFDGKLYRDHKFRRAKLKKINSALTEHAIKSEETKRKFVSFEQLCWKCAKATSSGCSWSKNFTPVEGWDATPTPATNVKSESYMIKGCPEFVEG